MSGDHPRVIEAFMSNYVGRTMFGTQLDEEELADLLQLRDRPPRPTAGPPGPDVAWLGPAGSVVFAGGKTRPVGGRLREAATVYERAGYHLLADALRNGLPWRNREIQLAPAAFRNSAACSTHCEWVTAEIDALLDNAAVGVYTSAVWDRYGPPRIVCGLHVDVKDDASRRLCYDYRYGNLCDGTGKVELMSLEDILPLLRIKEWMGKMDIRSGYHHVPLREEDAPYVCFHWEGVIYYWRCMFFGLRSAPRWFTEFTRPVVMRLRQVGATFIVYIDDFVFWLGNDRTKADTAMAQYTRLLTEFGWVVALDKCAGPGHEIEALGLSLNSVKMTIGLSSGRERKLLAAAAEIRTSESATVLQLQRFAGLLAGARLAVRLAGHLARPLHTLLREAGPDPKPRFQLTVSERAAEAATFICELWGWLHRRPVRDPRPVWFLSADSTPRQAGYVLEMEGQRHEAPFSWAEDDLRHISVKELDAMRFAVSECAQLMAHKSGTILEDNTVAHYYMRKGGGRVAELDAVAWELTRLLVAHRIEVGAFLWLPSEENVGPDTLSRMVLEVEWGLRATTFALILRWRERQGLRLPTVDAFASCRAKLLPRYIAAFHDPEAISVNYFKAQGLEGETLWVNAPWALLPRVLRDMQARGLRGLVLAPPWPVYQMAAKRCPWFAHVPARLAPHFCRPGAAAERGAGPLIVFEWPPNPG